ncbi:hemolysin III family protein [Candidatus Daviesbacteria bacterium]|nr:hemolysin III family protein [Candidatus Daviesbacteria bacterium]
MKAEQYTSILEEVTNSITHGVGLMISIIGAILLLVNAFKSDDFWKVLGVSIFGTTIILTYTFSTLYHGLYFTKANRVFKILDHSSIFLLILGTYSGFILAALKNNSGLTVLAIVWLVTILGIVYKSIFMEKFKILQVITYLFLGWIAVFILPSLLAILAFKIIILLLTGGLFYTLGLIFFAWKKLKFNHTIWHVFVLMGSICHFLALYIL